MNKIKEHKAASLIIGILIVIIVVFGYFKFSNQNVKPTSSTEVKQMLENVNDKDTIFYVYNSENKSENKYNKEINDGEKKWAANNPDGQIINADLADSSTRQALGSNSEIALDNLKNKMPLISLIHVGHDVAIISHNGEGTTDGKFIPSNINKMFDYNLSGSHSHNDLHSQLEK